MTQNCLTIHGPATPILIEFDYVSLDGQTPVKAKGRVIIDILLRQFTIWLEAGETSESGAVNEVREIVGARLVLMHQIWSCLERNGGISPIGE
jgi:hypothetical protein